MLEFAPSIQNGAWWPIGDIPLAAFLEDVAYPRDQVSPELIIIRCWLDSDTLLDICMALALSLEGAPPSGKSYTLLCMLATINITLQVCLVP